MDQPNQDEIIVASDVADIAVIASSSPPPYLKLIADCWEHIFDYLSAEDIYMMGQTCKRMHQMAGYYFREYLSEYRFNLVNREIRNVSFLPSFPLRTDFYQYIVALQINNRSESDYILDTQTFSSLKFLQIWSFNLNETYMGYMQKTLKNVEKIDLVSCTIHKNTYEQLANYCPKLKKLLVIYNNMSDPAFDTLFLHYYPELEHLYYTTHNENKRINELKVFLEKHKKLKNFGGYHDFLWNNRDLLNETNIRLDMLTISCCGETVTTQLVDFLKRLHERGFYKKWDLWYSDEMDTNLQHLRSAIKTLPILGRLSVSTDKNLSFLTMLKELDLLLWNFHYDAKDLEIMAKNLVKLERLTISGASNDYISPFIRHSKRLKTLKISSSRIDNDALDLFALNEERKTLANACRVLIYLPETIYLQEKWKSKNLNLSHIEFRRDAP